MALLTPDETYTTNNGILVSRKFLPESQRPNRKLNTSDNNPEYITIHNTDDINEATGTNDAEQYARATFNGNMNGVTVHFYIDETGCWQILPMDEVGYHAADGANGPGNTKSVAIEIIMDGSGKSYDTQAEERGAKLAAWLLYKYGLGVDKMVTHQHWYPKKYCPAYILPHWGTFVDNVKKYLSELKGAATQAGAADTNYLTYPMTNMNISQGYADSYSHAKHSSGSPADYPIDDCGADSGREWFYCPCDEMRIAHIYGVGKSGTNTIWLESTSPVVMPCGEDYVTIQVIHPNDDTLAGLKEGQVFKRGEKMFLEGNDGNATGYHCHIAVGTGKFTGSGWVQNSNGSWVNQTTGGQIKPENAFWIDDSFTKVINARGLAFKHLPSEEAQEKPKETKLYTLTISPLSKYNVDRLVKMLAENKFYGKVTEVQNNAGK